MYVQQITTTIKIKEQSFFAIHFEGLSDWGEFLLFTTFTSGKSQNVLWYRIVITWYSTYTLDTNFNRKNFKYKIQNTVLLWKYEYISNSILLIYIDNYF